MRYQIGRRAILAVYAVIIAVPLLVVVFGSLKTTPELFSAPFGAPLEPQLANYRLVLGGGGLLRALGNSVVVTGTAVVLTLAAAATAAFAITRVRGWRGGVLFAVLVIGMAVPAQANMIPQYVLFSSLGLTDSLLGLVLIEITTSLPIAVFIIAGFMKTLPVELFEASTVDGASPWRTFRSVVLPVSVPSLAAAAIFLLVIQWNDLLYPLLFITDPAKRTMPLALLDFQGQFLTNYPVLFAGVVIASLPMVLAYAFLQRYFIAGVSAGAVKG